MQSTVYNDYQKEQFALRSDRMKSMIKNHDAGHGFAVLKLGP